MKCTKQELISIFGISEFIYQGWLKEGLPKLVNEVDTNENGESYAYDTKDCIKWYGDYVISKAHAVPKSKYDANKEKARLLHHQANNEAMKERIASSEYVLVDQVLKKWTSAALSVRNRLIALPKRIARIALAASSEIEIEADTEKLIYEALDELSNFEIEGGKEETPKKPMGRPKKVKTEE